MLTPSTRLRPNTAEVAAKLIDGEAILINLSNGMYYSMDTTGGVVWELVERSHRIDEIANQLCVRYDVDGHTAEADVRRVVDDLLAARLVEAFSDDRPSVVAPPAPETRAPYQPPRLNSYHDMAELLALDPPHPWLSDPLSKPLGES